MLSRDDWYDDTLWHSQGILGEMLCEIRDTYLQNHPETIIQELEYFNRPRLRDEKLHISVQDCVIPTPSSLLHKSNSHPELRSLHGVPLTQVLAQRSAHIQLKSGSPSTGSTPNLQTLPAVPSKYPVLNPQPMDTPVSGTLSGSQTTSTPQSLQAVPPKQLASSSRPVDSTARYDDPNTIDTLPAASMTLTPTQNALWNLSQSGPCEMVLNKHSQEECSHLLHDIAATAPT